MTAQTRAGPRGGAAGSSEITKFSGFGSHKLPQAENQIASRNPRLQHLARQIHALGERPLYELFLDWSAAPICTTRWSDTRGFPRSPSS